MQQEIFYQLGDDAPVSLCITPVDAETVTPFVFKLQEEITELNSGDVIRHHYLVITGADNKTFRMFAKPVKTNPV